MTKKEELRAKIDEEEKDCLASVVINDCYDEVIFNGVVHKKDMEMTDNAILIACSDMNVSLMLPFCMDDDCIQEDKEIGRGNYSWVYNGNEYFIYFGRDI